jgi:hypothetical protein
VNNATARAGGSGVASSITGSSVTRAAGGDMVTGSPAAGGANTGVGGDTGGINVDGSAGGSGVVIFALPAIVPTSFSGGVAQTSAVVGTNRVYTVTAAGPTDTVTIG